MMKRKVALFFISTIFITSLYAQTAAMQQYINDYKNIAVNEMLRTGVPASITLAQGILESQSGQSVLVKQSNNHFGIKCKTEWTGATVYHDDDANQECFRSYATAEDSYRDHSDFLKNRPYYAPLFLLDQTDYAAWARGLKKAGYATAPDYAAKLIKIIEDNQLEQYSDIAIQHIKNNDPLVNYTSNTLQPNNTKVDEKEIEGKVAVIEKNKNTFPEGIFEINGAKVLYAKIGTSLFALSSNNNISYSSLMEYNDFGKTGAILNRNQLVFLERKSKRGDKDFHIVTANETMEDIAQEEGVRLENMLQYNQLQKGMKADEGEKIYLRGSVPSTPKIVNK